MAGQSGVLGQRSEGPSWVGTAPTPSSSSTSLPKALGQTETWGHSFRSTIQALSDRASDFERRHFDGDFLRTVSDKGRQVGERVSHISGELHNAAAKLVEEAAGRTADGFQQAEAPLGRRGQPVTSESVQAKTSSQPPQPSSVSSPPRPTAAADAAARGGTGTSLAHTDGNSSDGCTAGAQPSLLQQINLLQEELTFERELKKGRTAALTAMDEALRGLRAELVEGRKALTVSEAGWEAIKARRVSAQRGYETLQEAHDTLLSKQLVVDMELRRLQLAAKQAERLAKEVAAARRGPSSWARDGPETEALKLAKVDLALVLSQIDEVRLSAKQQAASLQKEIDAARGERDLLREAVLRIGGKAKGRGSVVGTIGTNSYPLAADRSGGPTTIRSSVWRLLAGSSDSS